MTPMLSDRKHPVHLPNKLRHNEPVIVFVTACSANRKPILTNSKMHDLLIRAWSLSRQWSVGRYIVMPDHVHLFCSPACHEAKNVKAWAGYWKGLVSRGLQGYGPLATPVADGVEAVPPQNRRDGLGGPGSTPADTDHAIWQRDVWDTQLRSGEHYHEKWEYVRMNPVRQELVDDPDRWPFQGELTPLLW